MYHFFLLFRELGGELDLIAVASSIEIFFNSR